MSKKTGLSKYYSKKSESPSKKFPIKMSIFVLQRYLCNEYWAMCYEVYLMCYNRSPFIDNGQKEETESSKIKILIDFLLLNCFILTQITLNDITMDFINRTHNTNLIKK